MESKNIQRVFMALSRSRFRSRFHLTDIEKSYVKNKGMDTIRRHAIDFIESRLSQAYPPKDGKQTPMRGHPVFIAQHATATCCRGCLFKWHHIPQGVPLNMAQKEYVCQVIMAWIDKEMKEK